MSEPPVDPSAESQDGHDAAHHGPPPGEKPRWLDDPKNVAKVFYALIGVCALLAAADFGYHKHAHFSFEEMHAFHGMFGFLAYVALVTTAKRLRVWLMRDEDYYD